MSHVEQMNKIFVMTWFTILDRREIETIEFGRVEAKETESGRNGKILKFRWNVVR